MQSSKSCDHGCYVASGQSTARDLNGRAYCSGCEWAVACVERFPALAFDLATNHVASPVLQQASEGYDTWCLKDFPIAARSQKEIQEAFEMGQVLSTNQERCEAVNPG